MGLRTVAGRVFAALALLLAACDSTSVIKAAIPVDYGLPGDLTVISKIEGPGCTTFRPEPVQAAGRGVPVIVWGNGTRSATAAYVPMLTHWASHGFVVVAANTNSAGTGAPMLACLDWLAAQDRAKGTVYSGRLDLTRIGASGHSQGGGGAIMIGRDARIKTTAPIQAYTQGLGYERGAETEQRGPMLLLSGGADTTAAPGRNQAPVFEKANVPIVWATLKGATHAVPAERDNGPYRAATTAWFLYRLKGDRRARSMFEGAACGYCRNADWTVQRKAP